MTANNLVSNELKEDIVLQLNASCKNSGCDWKGSVEEFIYQHIDQCDQDLKNMPQWVKSTNNNKEDIITLDDEVKRTENTLQLLRHIPQCSLTSRVYRRFKEEQKHSPRRYLNNEKKGKKRKKGKASKMQFKDEQDINNFVNEINDMKIGFNEAMMRISPDKEGGNEKRNSSKDLHQKKSDNNDYVVDFGDDSDKSHHSEDVKLKSSPKISKYILSTEKKENPFQKSVPLIRNESIMINNCTMNSQVLTKEEIM